MTPDLVLAALAISPCRGFLPAPAFSEKAAVPGRMTSGDDPVGVHAREMVALDAPHPPAG